MHNPIRSQWSLDALKLASSACGTNSYDCARQLGGTTAHATNTLKSLSASGHLHCIAENRAANRLNQYFRNGEDAVAWKQAAEKPNAAYRNRTDAAAKNHRRGAGIYTRRVERPLWHRAPMEGNVSVIPKDVKRTSSNNYPGCDIRYSLTEKEAKKFVGEWGSLKIGEYL